jgi:ABC-type glucose/galactose transport system permease subunit
MNMHLSKTHLYFSVKVLLAITMLSTLIAATSTDLKPEVPLESVFILCAIGVAMLLVILGFSPVKKD